MNFPSISGTQLLLGTIFLIVSIAIVIFYMRRRFVLSGAGLSEKYKEKKGDLFLKIRTKYPEVDAFRYSGLLLKFGFVAALIFLVLAFNYTLHKKPDKPEDYSGLVELVDVEVEPPRTQEQKPLPPPPPTVIEKLPEALIAEEETPVFEDMDIDVDEKIDFRPEPVKEEAQPVEAPKPPPPPPPRETKAPEIFKVVEDMPRFPGCEDLRDKEARKECSQRQLLKFIHGNIQYPAIARENNIEGYVVINFVVDEKGNIQDANIVKDLAGGCGQEALRVVNLMNDMPENWIPGMQRGKPVKVYFNLPVRFKLEH